MRAEEKKRKQRWLKGRLFGQACRMLNNNDTTNHKPESKAMKIGVLSQAGR